ncbi:hypothetical protein [Serpentinicella alkaliphila]|uniref:Uncharacterized protein n=1 Tax=Serpentinicella alkaliphila TaxID=1734049 RepID=A0A4V2T3J4_9FIRM|nr:hypothetical protein [Serpentinicella alkaliphila]QUH26204.1 hypothetical protein HZR23_11010 [Serpentinicella alkaliphila]TCQ01664.1 hypothetical protein EDD79_10245 [Serpentinicella alkaliphila]
MIIEAEIIHQPYSGTFEEKIYDVQSPWKSKDWTWVKFTNEDYTQWCGTFRGSSKNIALSKKHSSILILTSDCLFKLDIKNGNILEYEEQPLYTNLTVTPLGDYIVSDNYDVQLIQSSLLNEMLIKSPLKMDNIVFKGWLDDKLHISCNEFQNWSEHVELQLNCITLSITRIDRL